MYHHQAQLKTPELITYNSSVIGTMFAALAGNPFPKNVNSTQNIIPQNIRYVRAIQMSECR